MSVSSWRHPFDFFPRFRYFPLIMAFFHRIWPKSRTPRKVSGLLICCWLALAGCSESPREPVTGVKASDGVSAGEKSARQPEVRVPDEIKGRWKAVRIAVRHKTDGSQEVYTVDIGSGFRLADSGISLKVTAFLPDFVMDGPVMTSASDRADNPAARIEIYDGERLVYSGWLFSLYPEAHAFQHPGYGFTLVDFISVRQ